MWQVLLSWVHKWEKGLWFCFKFTEQFAEPKPVSFFSPLMLLLPTPTPQKGAARPLLKLRCKILSFHKWSLNPAANESRHKDRALLRDAIPAGYCGPYFFARWRRKHAWAVYFALSIQETLGFCQCFELLQAFPVLLCSWEGEAYGYQKLQTVPTSGDRHLLEERTDQWLPRALFSHIRERIKQIHSAILTDFL